MKCGPVLIGDGDGRADGLHGHGLRIAQEVRQCATSLLDLIARQWHSSILAQDLARTDLSVVAAIITGMDHPWRRLRDMTDWALAWGRLPGALQGRTDWATHTITLDPCLLQEERRCAIAHELEHIRHGPAVDDPVLAAREDHKVETAAAVRLVDMPHLIRALQWSDRLDEVADECWVDVGTLRARLASLTESERSDIITALGGGQ